MPTRKRRFGVNRRDFLKGSAAAGVIAAGGRLSWQARTSSANPPPAGTDALVCLFARGGLDALSAVVPYQETKYYDRRPNIAIPAAQVLDLNGQFGLHPALSELHNIYTTGDLAVVHAVGHPGQTRSHFADQDWIEGGADANTTTGWLARHLDLCAGPTPSPLRGISVDSVLPVSLRGTADAVSMVDPILFALTGWPVGSASQVGATLDGMFAGPGATSLRADLVERAAETRTVMDQIAAVSLPPPAPGVTYPATDLGERLELIASLIRVRATLPIEVLCADLLRRQSVDLHASMGTYSAGAFYNIARTVSEALDAFYADLDYDNLWDDVTLVIVSEFGRQVQENVGQGTDHGKAGCMFVIGGGVNGGVYTTWPGLDDAALDPPMGLAVTTDFRDVLGEVMEKRLGNANTTQVFPGLSYQPLGMLQQRV